MLPLLHIAKRTRNCFSKLFHFILPVKQLTGTRHAGMLPYEDDTIPQGIKSSFKLLLLLFVCFLLFFPFLFFPLNEKKNEVISSFLGWPGTAETLSSTWPELDLGPTTQRCPTAAPAPPAEPGSDLRMVLRLNRDQCPWETSVSVCGFAQRTKLSLFLLVSNHKE